MSLVENKKVGFNYEILEKIEAGIELLGFEVKALRMKRGSLDGSHVIARGNEAFLVGSDIPPYQAANTPKGYDSRRNRKLLLTKAEIKTIMDSERQRGLTVVPLSVYNKGRKIKVAIGIARGKKTRDKRQSIKKRETEREMRRTLKYK
jgi:SsrA-binding protein